MLPSSDGTSRLRVPLSWDLGVPEPKPNTKSKYKFDSRAIWILERTNERKPPTHGRRTDPRVRR